VKGFRKEDEKLGSTHCTKICDALMNEIEEKDKACQGFHVIIEADEESETESDGTATEDVSDRDWELMTKGIVAPP
jgi:hypothetical protein